MTNPDVPTNPRRRWYQFSLRTMFVVVTVAGVFLGWLGREWQFVQERRSFIDGDIAIQVSFADVRQDDPPGLIYRFEDDIRPVPIWRQLMGDRAVADVFVFVGKNAKTARRLFPEASITEDDLKPIRRKSR